ncbi:hypothetical protein [Achromobacter ruhlandii]|uniref:hypothetical protein n=1 Tax=Achromobacter ruhlandii TaxID=72557 RepID=UPI0007BFCE18|nr:hypothetical protein [Achromobacter ruhlandii]
MKKTLSLAIAALCLSATAQAHQVWIEQPAGKSAVIRFGEFAENLREASPGYLDGFNKLSAKLISAKGESPLTVAKVADGFTLSAKAVRDESLVAEEPALPLRKFKHGGVGEPMDAWFWMSARYMADASVAAKPSLTMDIVPTGKAGEFQIVLKGQPLAKTKLVAMVQSGWEKVAYTDAQGKAHLDLPWKGQYVLRAMHIDRTPGERAGANGPEHYDGIGYVSTLTFVKPDGAAPLPAGPVMSPNKPPVAAPVAAAAQGTTAAK